jgi:hypothetical protein
VKAIDALVTKYFDFFLKRGSSSNGEIPWQQRMPLRVLLNPATISSNSGEFSCEG